MFNDNVPQKEFSTFCSWGKFQGRRILPLDLKKKMEIPVLLCIIVTIEINQEVPHPRLFTLRMESPGAKNSISSNLRWQQQIFSGNIWKWEWGKLAFGSLLYAALARHTEPNWTATMCAYVRVWVTSCFVAKCFCQHRSLLQSHYNNNYTI